MHRTQNAALKMAARAADALIVLATYVATIRLREALMAWWPFDIIPGEQRTLQSLPVGPHMRMLTVILPAWLLGLQLGRTYDGLRRLRSDLLLIRIFRGVVIGTAISLTALFLLREVHTLSRTMFVGFAIASVPALFISRRVLVSILKRRFARGLDTYNILVVGKAGEALPLMRTLSNHADWGLRVMGVLHPDDAEERATSVLGYKVLGRVRDLARTLETMPVNQVFVTGRTWDVATLRSIADTCEEVGVELAMDANFLGLRVARADLRDFEGSTVLSFSATPRNAEAMVVKRIMDVVLAATALVALAPVFLITAIAIKIEDPSGPVFFGQQRSGLYGRTFTMWKFRSMVTNAEELKAKLEAHNEMDGPVFKMARDPRITRVGRFIRKTSIDELPQLWNVLMGEMSLVGPRPPLPAEVEKYERWQMRRLSMKPGITCIWQVSGRNHVDFKTWMQLDLQYIDNWSLFLDIKLLLKTVPAVLLGTGAR